MRCVYLMAVKIFPSLVWVLVVVVVTKVWDIRTLMLQYCPLFCVCVCVCIECVCMV